MLTCIVSGIYESCKKMALDPDKVVYLLKLLLNIPESVPPMQFEEDMELQKSHIRRSKEEIERLEQRIQTDLETAIKEPDTTMDELKQFSYFKEVMKNNGVTMTDNSRFVGAVVGAKKLGFDPHIIVQKVSNLMNLETE